MSHGSTVTIEFPGGDREAMLVASREEKEHTDLEICPRTHRSVGPCWKHAGAEVSYDLPNGRTMKVKIVEVHDQAPVVGAAMTSQ